MVVSIYKIQIQNMATTLRERSVIFFTFLLACLALALLAGGLGTRYVFMYVWVEEPISQVKQFSSGGATNNAPFPKMHKASTGK